MLCVNVCVCDGAQGCAGPAIWHIATHSVGTSWALCVYVCGCFAASAHLLQWVLGGPGSTSQEPRS